MTNQNFELEIGDAIGRVIYAQDIDSNDEIIYFPIVEITERDGERAYRYQMPDGSISSAAIHASRVQYFRIERETVIATEAAPNLAICLSDRRDEFKAALKRSIDGDFTVYAGWDNDSFFVVNNENKSEYRIEFETVNDRVFAECECKDFVYRKRVCKHIAAVLQETMFGVNLAV